ncbi:MAG: molybdopterin synthase sulfur carrier subunit, partial [Desulfobacteraceae bacterium IS3]
MTTYISIRLFATLSRFTPDSSEAYPIAPGIVIRELLARLGVSEDQAKLIFVNHLKA